MAIALIDYRAGNLTSVRKGFAAVGAELYTPSAAADLARADGIVVPGVGHFGATAFLDRCVAERDSGCGRRRPAAPRHLPRAAVALRRQRGSTAARSRRDRGTVHAAAADRESAARRLELARSDPALGAPRRHSRWHAGVLYALGTQHPSPQRASPRQRTEKDSPPQSSAITFGAFSSIPKSRDEQA